LLLWGLSAIALVALLVVTFRPASVPVDLATVSRGPLTATLDHEGRTRVRHRFVVSAPVAGRVRRISAEPGDAVVAHSTILATFVPAAPALLDARTRTEAAARVKAAEAAVTQADAVRGQAQAALTHAVEVRDRTRRLFEQGAAAKAELDAAVASASEREEDVRRANAAITSARHEVDAAKAVLLDDATGAAPPIDVRAPIDGVVLRRLHESEAVVPAGEPLLELADPADLEIVSDYLSTDAVQMTPGMVVTIDRWGGGSTLKGRVRLVEPQASVKVSALGVEEQRVNVIVAFDDPRGAWAALGDGYRVETHVVLWETADALKVPSSALFRRGSAWAVFVADAGRARLRKVEIGRQSGFEAQVLNGLSEGDSVLVHPSDTVADGVRIAPRG
jgi:HlyD family secretion protein